ncbi:hypothetical protein ALT761_03869 [Alteromonas sp. 76-1]|uniref:hypothetical protein n=1 Tax=Alteromonas sp. 76-1 TaxID=2358187 RepID=UPI000FD16711|nr:hypothetical protein [Alteromonas sp. 76-1]VEL98834.1 hypothetical protein ALT761_03869 [Alteromonas sp. 76-1]
MWEYKIVNSADAKKRVFLTGLTVEDVEKHLNSLGKQGGEIIDLDFQMDPTMPGGPTHFHGVAKRPK